jgi:hypothetical protein
VPDLARFYAEGATVADIEALSVHLAGSYLHAVTEAETFRRGARGPRRPVPGGLFCEVTFGPTADQWASLEVAGLLHPSGAMITRVPIPPPNQRPLLPADLPRTMPWEGAINEALVTLVDSVKRRTRMSGLGAPETVLAREGERVQNAFDQLVAAVRGHDVSAWPKSAKTRALVQPMRAPDTVPQGVAAIRALLFLSDTEVLVQTACNGAIYNALGRVVQRVPHAAPLATSVHGELVVFGRGLSRALDHYADRSPWSPDRPGAFAPFALWDRAQESLLATVPDGAPRFLVDESEGERMCIADTHTGLTLPLRLGASEPAFLASTRAGRFAWIGERDDSAVVELSTGIFFAEPPMGASGEHAAALALTPAGAWRFVTPSGRVGDHVAYFANIEGAYTAAAFSPDAAQIALARGTRVEVRSADPSLTLLRSFDLQIT